MTPTGVGHDCLFEKKCNLTLYVSWNHMQGEPTCLYDPSVIAAHSILGG
jgi:hypothetical protein